VYAFEPLASTFERLERACELNRLGNVTLFPEALGAADGTGQLYAHETATGNASMIHDRIARLAKPREVAVTTLDTLDRAGSFERLDLIKIDVEGLEMEVLRGGKSLLARTRPHMVLEFNERMSRLAGWGKSDLAAFLAGIGSYEFYRIDEWRLTKVELPEMPIERNTHLDLFALSLERRRPEGLVI
jgi:FkbM family methyltransferase